MAECTTVESDSVPQLPLNVLTKVASMLQRNETESSAFKDRLQLASVSRELRQAVLSSIQQMKRRHMKIEIEPNNISVAGIIVKNDVCPSVARRLLSGTQQIIRRMMPTRVNRDSNGGELSSSYTQMDCIGALLAFAQPNSLYLSDYDRSLSRSRILMRSLPLSLTSLLLELAVTEIGVDTPLDQALQAVASKTNLQTLKIEVYCAVESVRETHLKTSPSVPKDSPFNHLLTLKNLRALYFNSNYSSNSFLWPDQIADLLNRSPSKISNICCLHYNDYGEREKLFDAMNDVVRGNIVSICCVCLSSLWAKELRFLDRLPNCSTVHFEYYGSSVSREEFDELGGRLLDVCCTDDVQPGRTVECMVGGYNALEEYLEEGGETQIEYARNDTVVRLSIGSDQLMERKHCPFNNNPYAIL